MNDRIPLRLSRWCGRLALLCSLLPVPAALGDPAEGLWVGRAILSEVNEVVSAVNADNVRVQTPPDRTTATSDQAEILLIVHVDGGGQARLLKSVAIVDSDPDPQVVEEGLITDPRLYGNYTLARRIASAAFEFGDPDSRLVVDSVAAAAAEAAVDSTDPVAAAEGAIAAAAAGSYSPSLLAFIASDSFADSADLAGDAAGKALAEKTAEGLTGPALEDAVKSEVLIAMQTVSQMADGATLDELPMTGALAKGQTVEADIFLGAYHPVNPFRHRRHPSHRGGFDIQRHIKMTVAEPEGGDDFDTTERGIDRLSGTYEEEIFGLHKPLGQSGEHGLITKGGFVLDRISRDATLND